VTSAPRATSWVQIWWQVRYGSCGRAVFADGVSFAGGGASPDAVDCLLFVFHGKGKAFLLHWALFTDGDGESGFVGVSGAAALGEGVVGEPPFGFVAGAGCLVSPRHRLYMLHM